MTMAGNVGIPCPCGGCGRRLPGATAGWHQRKGPLPLLQARHGLSDWGELPRWVDHPYRLRLPDGRWRYVAEPYDIDDETTADLIHLREHGFLATISANAARHNPGRTVAVLIEEGDR